jgi:D-glycero-D-manno-heptose 1,7-bisphosphate phosphatase
MSRGAVFVDRDGTLNALVADPVSGAPESPLRVDDVELIPRAAAAVRRLNVAGWPVVGVTNQPAAAKGTASLAELAAVQARVVELAARDGADFEDFRICWHHPSGIVPALSLDCDCRKPKPGMLLEAALADQLDLSASWMIGDSDADVLAGQAAGAQTILLEYPPSAHRRAGDVTPTAAMPDLDAAVSWFLSTRLVDWPHDS